MKRQLFALVTAGCLLVAGCGSSKKSDSGNASDSAATTESVAGTEALDTTTPTSDTSTVTSDDGSAMTLPMDTMAPLSSVVENPLNAKIDFGSNKPPQDYDEFLQASLADIQDYWRETFPQVYGTDYAELTGGIWASFPGRAEPIPDGCASDPSDEYPAVGNAFYCGNGDYIAYDDAQLIPQLTGEFGEAAVGVVFAHEFGHAIQARSGGLPADTPTIYSEQQADCFAGSWTAHVARGESAQLVFGDQEIKAGLSAMVAVKDSTLGEDVQQGDAHGSAFDRVGAFENGFKGGAEACKDMETTPLPLLDLPFTTEEEFNSGGNIPYDDVTTSVEADLTRFWTSFTELSTFTSPTVVPFDHEGPFPTCEGIEDSQYPFSARYCAGSNTIFIDDGYARALYETYGDFAVGYVLSDAWSDAVQTNLESVLVGEQRDLINDCFTGVWTNDIIPPADGVLDDTKLYISPGDLDEAVETALLSDAGMGNGEVGSAFDKIDYFRAGVIGGLDECVNRISA
jgi:predicted metalloprotease